MFVQVKFWITLNEPFVVSNHGYEIGVMAPGLKGKGDRIYASGHNLIRAHAKAYRIYERDFKSSQKGCFFHLDEKIIFSGFKIASIGLQTHLFLF